MFCPFFTINENEEARDIAGFFVNTAGFPSSQFFHVLRRGCASVLNVIASKSSAASGANSR